MEEERLISLKEAAARFGVSHSHLRLLVRAGKVQGKKMGRDWFTTEAAVAAYLQGDTLRRRGPRKRKK